jgi:ABC-type nitrate/sulfonate/bicarbonate transport system ATPase subunit
MKLACSGVAKTFHGAQGDVTALGGVDLEIGEGEFVSIVGPSGCGKSTLLNVLSGLLAPTSGEIRLDGSVATALLGRVGYMPQRDLLMPWRHVLDNVTVGLEITGTTRREARARATAQLDRFGLAGFERRWPATLSGGMRQRAALLRTFLAGRDLMLLDEPFGALDAITRQSMQKWLLEIWQSDRKTILFVTHDVEEAIYLSDRVYLMSSRPGRIQLCLKIDLLRPRPLEVTTTHSFVTLKRRLLGPLRAASRTRLEEQT